MMAPESIRHVREEPVMRRPVLFGSLLSLFVVAGVVLIAGSVLLAPPPLTSASGNTEVIRRFYAAANETIATGDTTALHAIVAPHFVDQDPVLGMKQDRVGLEGYLAALHAVAPDRAWRSSVARDRCRCATPSSLSRSYGGRSTSFASPAARSWSAGARPTI
jgi:hypothetical protein